MSVYKTKFYGEYKFSDNATPYLLTYLSKFFRTIHIEWDVEKIKESYYNWKDYSYYGDLGYEGELYVNPEDKSYGNKNLMAVTILQLIKEMTEIFLSGMATKGSTIMKLGFSILLTDFYNLIR